MKKFFLIFGIGIVSILGIPNFSLAQEDQEYPGIQKNFKVSAYYSPQPNQVEYVSGSYQADLRMNGNGIHGADGTPVYVGMIAAPNSYDFGTQIYIPGLGIGTVHDRGGAIYTGENFTRLDVWMGKGDEGRIRALQWGSRVVSGIVLEEKISETLEISTSEISRYSSSQKLHKNFRAEELGYFSDNLEFGNSGESVKKMQRFLRRQHLYKSRISSQYDTKTQDAVLSFQMEKNIIASKNSYGAGFWGPKTRRKAEEVRNAKLKIKNFHKREIDHSVEKKKQKKQQKFLQHLAKEDENSEVQKVQEFLKSEKFFTGKTTQYFGPKTEYSIFLFQKKYDIVHNRDDLGAGVWGPKTRARANILLLQKK